MPDKLTAVLKRPAAAGLTPAELLKNSASKLNILPTLPEAASRAMAAANQPRQSLGKLARIVESDPAMAAALLRLANSPLYRIGRIVDSLEQAVVRLGLRESKNLIVAVGLKSIFGKIPPSQRTVLEKLWRHSFLTGTISRHLNQLLELGFQGEEFTCGLSHDLGRVLFAIVLRDKFAAVDPIDFREDDELLAREQTALETDHCRFGAWFATYSQLPSSLASVIQHHHTPTETKNHQSLVALVATADDMANVLQRDGTAEGYDLESNRGWRVLRDLLDPSQQAKLSEGVLRLITDADRESRDALTF